MKEQEIPVETTFQITIDDFEEIPEESTSTENITIIQEELIDDIVPTFKNGCCGSSTPPV